MRATAQQWDEAVQVSCPFCLVPAGRRCVVPDWGEKTAIAPHRRRVRLALAVRAHGDPALDGWPQLGPSSQCGLCGVPGMPQRHRVIDAMAGWMATGEADPEDMAGEYQVPVEAALAVAAWMEKWPGAWL